MTPGEQSAELYGGIRPRRRDRYGELVEDENAVHGECKAAITTEILAERYYRARKRADRILERLTASELEAVEDAISAERARRRIR